MYIIHVHEMLPCSNIGAVFISSHADRDGKSPLPAHLALPFATQDWTRWPLVGSHRVSHSIHYQVTLLAARILV
jgi:hypothetical protein